MNILLVYPTGTAKYQKAYMPPLVPGILAALTPKQHNVTIVNDAVDEIPYEDSFDLVAITAMTVQATRAYEIAARFRKLKVPVVMGGFHTAVMKEDAEPHVDSVVVGDAELIWEEILADANNGGLKKEYYGPQFDLQKKIFPDYSKYDFSKYVRIPWLRMPLLPTHTTRGCPMGCEYCSVTLIHGKKYRHRPISHILEEMSAYNDNRLYFFVDDNITGDISYARELFKALKKWRTENVTWFSQISMTLIDHPELIELAAESGCVSALVGIESINQHSLDSVGKKFNHVEKYEELFRRLYSVGIVPFVSMIFGFDEDTPETFEQTLEFHARNDIMLTVWWMLAPPPGTPFRERMEKEGRIIGKKWSDYNGTEILIKPKQMSLRELMRCYWDSYQKYFTLTPAINERVQEKYDLTKNTYMGAIHMQELARRQVQNRLHPFAMGSV